MAGKDYLQHMYHSFKNITLKYVTYIPHKNTVFTNPHQPKFKYELYLSLFMADFNPIKPKHGVDVIYRDRKANTCIREQAKVTDVIEQVRRREWTWVGHVSRIRDIYISVGIPARRWRDDLGDYWKITI